MGALKEKVKVIKENITFKELPKDIQKTWINIMADEIIESFDEGVYDKKTATIDAKRHYLEFEADKKYILFHSNFYGIVAKEEDKFQDYMEDL